MSTIHERLVLLEAQFLDAISTESPAAVASFEDKWVQLHIDLEAASHAGTLAPETAILAHNIASKVTISAEALLSLGTETDNVTQQLEELFGERLSLDIPPVGRVDSRDDKSASLRVVPLTSQSTPRLDASLPPYIEPAYRWLLKHLHNPYPNKEIKQKFADASGASIERISDWFVDVRRRMGWTLLLREEFYRKRNSMVDAAKTYFLTKNPLPPHIYGKFVEIETAALDLYKGKFDTSALSNRLITSLKDLTPELQEKARAERKRREAANRATYPSPPHSRASSPISDPGASTSRKRSNSDLSDDERSSSKRSRTDDGPSSEAFTMPSPPDSRYSSPSSSRKRRLSDAEAPGAKRPRNRAASDPIPVTVTLSGTPDILADWFSSDREGDTDLFKPGQLLDIKFFDPADYDFDELAVSPVEPVLQELKTLPQQTLETPEMITFDIPSEIQNLFNFSDYTADFDLTSQPSYGSFTADSYGSGPAVYEQPAFIEPFMGGQNYDPGYITRESVAQSFAFDSMASHDNPVVYSAFPGDGRASNQGHLEPQQKIQNEYGMYQPVDFLQPVDF